MPLDWAIPEPDQQKSIPTRKQPAARVRTNLVSSKPQGVVRNRHAAAVNLSWSCELSRGAGFRVLAVLHADIRNVDQTTDVVDNPRPGKAG